MQNIRREQKDFLEDNLSKPIPTDSSKDNLLKKILFFIFKNVQSIVLITAGPNDKRGYYEYIVNIPHLLQTIREALSGTGREIKIILRARHNTKMKSNKKSHGITNKKYIGKTWITKAWENMKQEQREPVGNNQKERKQYIIMSARNPARLAHDNDGNDGDVKENEENRFKKKIAWIEVWEHVDGIDGKSDDEDIWCENYNYQEEEPIIEDRYKSDKYLISFEQISIWNGEGEVNTDVLTIEPAFTN